MSVRAKNRRKIIVNGETYYWYVALDSDTPYNNLNIVSEDKCLILSCPLESKVEYVISKGRIFKTKETDGCWNRYLLPFHVPDIVTPKFVEKMIVWATQDTDAARINGIETPV